MNRSCCSCVSVLVALGVSATLEAQQRELQVPNKQFRDWDENGDGKLTRDELPERIRQNFDRVDVNSDGAITVEEDAAFRNRGRDSAKGRAGRKTRPLAKMPASIKVQRDIAYAGSDTARQKLDLYLPTTASSDEPLPVVVWIHGGAWRAGDKASGFGHLRKFVASGDFAAVSVGYRLSDEAIWPAQIHDCKAAIRWIRAMRKSTTWIQTALVSGEARPADTWSACWARPVTSRSWKEIAERPMFPVA